MLRMIKILLVGAVAVWGLIGAVQNIGYWGETTGSVKAVTTMSTFEGGPEKWKATDNSVIVFLGAAFIALSKLTAGLLCLFAGVRMFGARGADAQTFAAAKKYAVIGTGVAVFMLFGGFIVVAEGWFELWRSAPFGEGVLSAAFRYAAIIGLIGLFVGATDD